MVTSLSFPMLNTSPSAAGSLINPVIASTTSRNMVSFGFDLHLHRQLSLAEKRTLNEVGEHHAVLARLAGSHGVE